MSEKTLRICHLYPDLLNLYGDRGNILCMRRRLEWRGIGAEVTEVTVGEQADFTQFDLFFIGGGQDFEQEVLLSDLKAGKGGEIQLTDAIAALVAAGQSFDAFRFRGSRFDCGTHLGLVEATIRYALDHERLSDAARRLMQDALQELGVVDQ